MSVHLPIERVVHGRLDKHGYLDAAQKKQKKVKDSILDVHDHRKDLDYAAERQTIEGQMTCEKVKKILEQNHAVDECVVIDINVNHEGEIPVAFVVKRLGSEGCDEELHKQLINSLRLAIGHAGRHEELEKDLIAKVNHLWENDTEIKDDLIRDELVNVVRDEFGPYALLKVIIVDALPKTICGRILRGTLMKIARSEPYGITPMIEDRNVLFHLEKEIHALLGDRIEEEEEEQAV